MKNKKMTIGVLCIALVFMGIGFALLQASLNITGTATSSGTFDVKITNVALDTTKKTAGALDTTEAPGANYAVTEQTLSATFSEPGDYITWTLTVTNRGTIEAAFTLDAEPQEDINGAYKLSCNAEEGTILAPSATTTFQCEMSFDKNRTLTAQEFAQLPKGTNVTMTVSVTAVQSSEYVAPIPETNIFVGKTFTYEKYSEKSGAQITNMIMAREITATTLEFFDSNSNTYVQVPYTYDSTNHTVSVANGMYIMYIIELDNNIIMYNTSLGAVATSNSNVGTQLMTGYSFQGSSPLKAGTYNFSTFEDANGTHGIINGTDNCSYYLIDNSVGNNGEALLVTEKGVFTVTKVNGVYTTLSSGGNTYNLVAPTP